MVDPNKVSSTGKNVGDRPTGWESVAEMAGQMNPKEQVEEREKKNSTPEEINATCERVLGRTADDTGRELQLLDFINGYRTMEYKDPEKHRELLEIAASGTAIGREDTDYEDGEMKGLKHTITAILPDGSRVTEERVYSTLKPELKTDRIARYVYDGVLEESDVQAIRAIHGLLEGQGSDLGQTEAEELRNKGGEIKTKVMHHYSEMYKKELFHDDGADKEGLKHIELDGGQKVTLFQGAKFKMLAHVRFAMEMSTGKRTAEDLMQGEPVADWSLPRKDKDGKDIAPPHALSTSLISSEKIHLYKPSEIIYGFTNFEGDGIITMGTEDLASYSNGPSKYAIKSARFNERMMSPDELIATTGARREENGETYNEVVVDRYSGKDNGIIQPNCLIVFGKNEEAITPLQRRHAEAFGIPIYVIDSEKYGGVQTTWGEKAVPKAEGSSTELEKSKEIDPKKVAEIDKYMMANLEMDNPAERTAMAHYVADFAGVASGVKPTALVVIPPSNMNMQTEQLAKLIDEAGMQVADGWENGRFFISRSKDLATQSKDQFHRLWSGERTPEVDHAIGELLGYPETAINQDFSERPKGILARLKHIRSKKVRPELEWHYVHNPEFQDEEFEAYEKPLHEYMDANCPVAASVLKKEKTSLGRPKKWL